MSAATSDAIRDAIRAHIEESAGVEAPMVTDYVIGAAYIRPTDSMNGAWYVVHASDSPPHSLEGLANHVARELMFCLGDDDDEA